MKNQKLIIANWKMNPSTLEEAKQLFKLTADLAKNSPDAEVVICPPFIYLSNFQFLTSNLQLGAQDCFWENKGAYTGEISLLMLKNLGVQYVIIGHSERRENLNETNDMINKKLKACLKSGLKAVFCVGEKERNESQSHFNFIKEEIESGLKDISWRVFKNIVIAYEPIWAISATVGASAMNPAELSTIVIFIRKVLFDLYKTKKIFDAPILYGGSVDAKNFQDFLNVEGVSGFLIGGASLNPKELSKILAKK